MYFIDKLQIIYFEINVHLFQFKASLTIFEIHKQ